MPSWNFYVLWFITKQWNIQVFDSLVFFWNFTLVWIIIIWWNIWSFDSFSDSEILMPLNHYTYLKNLMTMILFRLWNIYYGESFDSFEKFKCLDSFKCFEILMPLNHYTYLKNLMSMILYILYEILAFNKSLHIFEKFDDLILFYHLKYFFLWIIIFFWNFNKFDSLHIHEIYFSMNHYILLKY